MGRPKEHDEATRERLLEAAEHLSGAQGWEALTVRGIAEEAGTSTRALYALFDSCNRRWREILRMRRLTTCSEPFKGRSAIVTRPAPRFKRLFA